MHPPPSRHYLPPKPANVEKKPPRTCADLTFQQRPIWTNVCRVHAIDDDPPRLTDLRGAQPADVTFQNLLQLLKEKIELCGRLAVYEYEARSEEHFECAESFRALAAAERASYESLLRSLTGLLAKLNGT